jgi:large subunit ribosomal protein L17
MRHQKRKRKLNRTSAERRALLRSLVRALLEKERIRTTLAKAKEARRLAEKIITLGKRADLASQRRAFSVLLDRTLVKKLMGEIAPRFKNRQGGYTRIIRLSEHRKGDNAPLVLLELTEQKIVEVSSKKVKKAKTKEIIKEEKTVKEEVKIDKTIEKELPKEKPAKTEEPPKYIKEQKRPHREEKRPSAEKDKKGFFQGLKRFLKPKTG